MRRVYLSLCLLGLAVPMRAAPPPAPVVVTINLESREAVCKPSRQGCTHTGGGNIDVAQPTPDTLVVTMTGVAVATGHPCKDSVAALTFDLLQHFEIAASKPLPNGVRLTVEARVIGL